MTTKPAEHTTPTMMPPTHAPARDRLQVDVQERGMPIAGVPQVMDRRLFMQLLVFRADAAGNAAKAVDALGSALDRGGIAGVVYEDVNDPQGLALLTWSEDPAHFVEGVRPLLAEGALSMLTLRPEMTMLGRTYSSGF